MTATFDNQTIMSMNVPSLSAPNGFVAVGPDRFGVASFDNLRIVKADVSSVAQIVSRRHSGLAFVPKPDVNNNERNNENMIAKELFDAAVNLL